MTSYFDLMDVQSFKNFREEKGMQIYLEFSDKFTTKCCFKMAADYNIQSVTKPCYRNINDMGITPYDLTVFKKNENINYYISLEFL